MPRRARRAAFAALLIGLILMLLSVNISGYSNRNPSLVLDSATTCGSEGACHGEASSSVVVTIDGPDALEINEATHYTITVNGGPSQRYGYYVTVQDTFDRSKDPSGNLLFNFTPQTHEDPLSSNTFVLNFTAPKYASNLKMIVAVNSVNADGGTSGDAWTVAEKEVEVHHHEMGVDPLNVTVGAIIVAFVFVSTWAFFLYKRRLLGS